MQNVFLLIKKERKKNKGTMTKNGEHVMMSNRENSDLTSVMWKIRSLENRALSTGELRYFEEALELRAQYGLKDLRATRRDSDAWDRYMSYY